MKKKKNLDPPKWDKTHKIELNKLKKKKKTNDKIKKEKAIKIKEFNLHDGKKKENMYQKYVENGGQIYKEPTNKRNIIIIIFLLNYIINNSLFFFEYNKL